MLAACCGLMECNDGFATRLISSRIEIAPGSMSLCEELIHYDLALSAETSDHHKLRADRHRRLEETALRKLDGEAQVLHAQQKSAAQHTS